MKRYKFLTKEGVFGSLNKLRAAFLAAKNGSDVDEILKSILTYDERIKIGRRVQIANLLKNGKTYRQIQTDLKVGKQTVLTVDKNLTDHPVGFELINRREGKVEKEFRRAAYVSTGGPKMVYKRKIYTGLKRKDIER